MALVVVAALAVGFGLGRATAPGEKIDPLPPARERSFAPPAVGAELPARADHKPPVIVEDVGDLLTFVTWNVRGYPEKLDSDTAWLHRQLTRLGMDVLCIQEIANLGRVTDLRARDGRLTQFAFTDSRQGTDNAILADGRVMLEDMSSPTGFQHPPQVAYVSRDGFDAVVVCLHLTWTDASIRDQEVGVLRELLPGWLERDPDVILVGDFNLTEGHAGSLARSMGMTLMVVRGQDGVGTTHSGNRYDHFLISADLVNEEAVSARIETFEGDELAIAQRVSDHLPVVATFRMDEQFRDRVAGN